MSRILFGVILVSCLILLASARSRRRVAGIDGKIQIEDMDRLARSLDAPIEELHNSDLNGDGRMTKEEVESFLDGDADMKKRDLTIELAEMEQRHRGGADDEGVNDADMKKRDLTIELAEMEERRGGGGHRGGGADD